MKRIPTFLLAIIATGHLAAQSKSPESMLGAALYQEEVQRDIKGAIASYNLNPAHSGVSDRRRAQC